MTCYTHINFFFLQNLLCQKSELKNGQPNRGKRNFEVFRLGIESATLGIEPATLGIEPATLGIEPATLGIDPATLKVGGIFNHLCLDSRGAFSSLIASSNMG